jgi:putative aldouronate transport system permease protein
MIDNNKPFQICGHAIMILLSIICLFPFVLMIASSFANEQTLLNYGYSLIPREFSLESYKYLLNNSDSIVRGYSITLSITVIGTFLNVMFTILIAYPLSRKELPFRKVIAFIVFFTMLFNGGVVSSYIMWSNYFHIKNTLFALLVPNLMLGAFFIMMMRTYFSSNIPDAILEAARIDGANEWYILFKIVIPISQPIIVTIALFAGLQYWNDWVNGLYYISDDRFYSIQVLLNRMLSDVQYLMSSGSLNSSVGKLPSTGIKMAIAVIGAVPVLIVYPFFQKYFIKGITIGAVKG